MIVIGLTGSIGMGKSTTAQMLREEGVAVFDADAAVHELYKDSGVIAEIAARFPEAATPEGGIDRRRLAAIVVHDDAHMKLLEGIFHPRLLKMEEDFILAQRRLRRPFCALDIPLLFETGAERRVDIVAVVTAPALIQRQRVMARPGMTEEKFKAILARQVPDAEKRRRADYIIQTGHGLATARRQVKAMLRDLRAKPPRPRTGPKGRPRRSLIMGPR